MKYPNDKAAGFGLLLPIILIAVVAVAALVAWSVHTKQTSTKSSQPTANSSNATHPTTKKDALMAVEYSGGLCPPGQQPCGTAYNIFEDGTFEGHTKLSAMEVDQLREVIDKTDFLQYKPSPNPACPSAHDGQDQMLVFPLKYPDKSFTLCALQIPDNDEAITFIRRLIQAHEITDTDR